MIKPRYQDYQAKDIPTVHSDSGCDVRVMAGEFEGHTGANLQLHCVLQSLSNQHIAAQCCTDSVIAVAGSTS